MRGLLGYGGVVASEDGGLGSSAPAFYKCRLPKPYKRAMLSHHDADEATPEIARAEDAAGSLALQRESWTLRMRQPLRLLDLAPYLGLPTSERGRATETEDAEVKVAPRERKPPAVRLHGGRDRPIQNEWKGFFT